MLALFFWGLLISMIEITSCIITYIHIPVSHQPHITLKYVLSVLWFISQAHMTLWCELNHDVCKKTQPQASHRAKGFTGQLKIYITYQTHMGYITFIIKNLPIAALVLMSNGCVLLEESILVAVDSCLVSVQTVFTWLHVSHKILNLLANPYRYSRLIFTSSSTLSHAMQDIWLARYVMFTILLPSTESLPASRLWSASPSETVRGHISENSCGSESESACNGQIYICLSDDLNGYGSLSLCDCQWILHHPSFYVISICIIPNTQFEIVVMSDN